MKNALAITASIPFPRVVARYTGGIDFKLGEALFSAFRCDGTVVSHPTPGTSFYPTVTPEILALGRQLVGWKPPAKKRRPKKPAPMACMCGAIDPPCPPGDDGLERCIYCGCH